LLVDACLFLKPKLAFPHANYPFDLYGQQRKSDATASLFMKTFENA
jgi:hypothetical protein